jgi:peptidyl-prolyl cis-trans isomerase SurA
MTKSIQYSTIILLFLCLSIATMAQNQLLDKVVCQVGGEIILLSDVEARIAYIKATYGDVDEDTRCFVLQELIAQKLLINQAKLDSIVVTDEEVNQQIDARINRILSAMGNDEKRFEAYYGLTVDEVRREQQENLRNTLYTDKMRGQVMADVVATPAEVNQFFASIPKDSLPFFNSEVEISEIIYKPSPSEKKKMEARKTLEDLRNRILEDPSQFERLSNLYSDDPGSQENGGDLGWQARGTFVPEFEAAAYNLENNEFSEVVETEFGFHLIQLLERRGNLIHTRHILIKPEFVPADIELAEDRLDSIKQLLISDSISFEYAVRLHSDKNSQSYNNGGRMTNPATGNTFFEIGDLDSDVFFAIDDLKVGEYSDPVLYDNLNEDPHYKLFRLDSRSAPHAASLEQDYSKIQNYASEQKKQKLFNEWLFDRVGETHVQVDARYTCPDLDIWLNQ